MGYRGRGQTGTLIACSQKQRTSLRVFHWTGNVGSVQNPLTARTWSTASFDPQRFKTRLCITNKNSDVSFGRKLQPPDHDLGLLPSDFVHAVKPRPVLRVTSRVVGGFLTTPVSWRLDPALGPQFLGRLDQELNCGSITLVAEYSSRWIQKHLSRLLSPSIWAHVGEETAVARYSCESGFRADRREKALLKECPGSRLVAFAVADNERGARGNVEWKGSNARLDRLLVDAQVVNPEPQLPTVVLSRVLAEGHQGLQFDAFFVVGVGKRALYVPSG